MAKSSYLLGALAIISLGGLYYFSTRLTSGPRSYVSPVSGGPGTNFLISGKGFPPGTTQDCSIIGANGLPVGFQNNIIIQNDGTFTPFGLIYTTVGGTGTYKVTWPQLPSANTSFIET